MWDNDTDPDGDPLTAAVDTQPGDGTLTLDTDGSLTYTPDTGFSGIDTFTYIASDGTDTSQPATVRLTVTEDPNEPPTVAVASGGDCALSGNTGTLVLAVADPDSDPAALSVTATSSQQTLLPDSRLSVDGQGATRTLTAATVPTSSGRATVQITVDDGALQSTTTLVVTADADRARQLDGPPGSDLLLGRGGDDILTGAAGTDLLCGAAGDDTLCSGLGRDGAHGGAGNDFLYGQANDDALRGGAGSDILHGHRGDDLLQGGVGGDLFSGGAGNDTIVDLDRAEGDTTNGT